MSVVCIVLTQRMYPKVMSAIRNLAGGGMMMLPSGVEGIADEELARFIEKAQHSPSVPLMDGVKFFKLAWDAVGAAFASRHTQYEMFYAGALFVRENHTFNAFD